MAVSILQHQRPGIEGVVPSYNTLAVLYDPIRIDFATLTDWLWELEAGLDRARLAQPRIVEIPVCYGGAFVAAHNRIGVPEEVAIHSRATDHIYAVGFAPGFCYLGSLAPRLHAPRLETPRTRVAAGSVGIAGAQTVGGYTVIATVISPDLFRIAQAKPGNGVKFVRLDLGGAHAVLRKWNRFLAETGQGLMDS